MSFNFDRIDLLGGSISFSIVFFLMNCIFIIHFLFDWYRNYKRNGMKFDYWRFFCVLNIFIPIMIMYPFAASVFNFISTGKDIIYISNYVDEAYFISIFGYISMLIGRYICGNKYNLKLNIIETYIYTNLINKKFYIMIYFFIIVSFLLVIILSYLYPEYLLTLRLIRFDNPLIGALINIIMSITHFSIIFLGLHLLESREKHTKYIFFITIILPILMGVRSVLIIPLITLVAIIFCYYNSKIKIWHYIITSISTICMLILLTLIRDGGSSGQNSNINILIFIGQILYGNTFSDLRDFSWVLTGFNDNYVLGKTYLSALFSYIPSGISDFREVYKYGEVTNHFAGIVFDHHFGLRMTIFGEMYINFGYIGVFIISVFMGYLLQYTNNNFLVSIKEKRSLYFVYTKTIIFMIYSSLFFNSSSFYMIYMFILLNILGKIFIKIKY